MQMNWNCLKTVSAWAEFQSQGKMCMSDSLFLMDTGFVYKVHIVHQVGIYYDF